MLNREKQPAEWSEDVLWSVAEYDDWYLDHSPALFAAARGRAVREVDAAMEATDDFRAFTPESLRAKPSVLFVARMCVSPTMARDRFTGFSGVSKSMVKSMEVDGKLPPRLLGLEKELRRACDFLRPLFDPSLFAWLEADRPPSREERDRAKLVVGERLAGAFYGPVLRNEQERRQKTLLEAWLRERGFQPSPAAAFSMPQGTYAFGRNVPVVLTTGKRRNLPVDCVVAPMDGSPLACIELKSAGDYTNTNKRRKEEADKKQALDRTYGDRAIMLLQLFGYFDRGYLEFEASEGLDWAWDHRLDDLAPYLGQ